MKKEIEIINLIDVDFINYKVPSMYIGFPKCDFKCDRECGQSVCQNSDLANLDTVHICIDSIVERYIDNKISKAIVLAGLEPFDTFTDMLMLISKLREYTQDNIVIYTGYYKNEIIDKIDDLVQYPNIVIKFGRYIPQSKECHNDILGIKLASSNQWAEIIS